MTVIIRQISGLILLTVLLTSCATKRLTKTTTYTYSNVEFSPTSSDRMIGADLTLSIEPVDAKVLNHEAYESLMKNDTLYINDNSMHDTLKVYALVFMTKRVYFAQKEFVPANVKKRKVELDFERKN